MRQEVATPYTNRTEKAVGIAVATFSRAVIRASALSLFLLMSLAEPFVAVVLSTLAMGCFVVSVLFGFIFHAPFPHRLFVLGASLVFMVIYFAYRFLMLGVERLMR